jgi:hypothetical protein
MKLSKLRALCDKAIEKYGDMEVGAFSQDYAFDVDSPEEMYSVKLRILSRSGSLPGESLDKEEDEDSSAPVSRFACIFYED